MKPLTAAILGALGVVALLFVLSNVEWKGTDRPVLETVSELSPISTAEAASKWVPEVRRQCVPDPDGKPFCCWGKKPRFVTVDGGAKLTCKQ